MSMIRNERGFDVWAEGSPNSLARLKCEFPDSWFRMMDYNLIEYMALHPTHEYEAEIHFGTGISPQRTERRFCTLLGEVIVNGKKEYHYAEMVRLPDCPVRTAEKFYAYEEFKRIPQDIPAAPKKSEYGLPVIDRSTPHSKEY